MQNNNNKMQFGWNPQQTSSGFTWNETNNNNAPNMPWSAQPNNSIFDSNHNQSMNKNNNNPWNRNNGFNQNNNNAPNVPWSSQPNDSGFGNNRNGDNDLFTFKGPEINKNDFFGSGKLNNSPKKKKKGKRKIYRCNLNKNR